MSYGIYDNKSETLIFGNLPSETTFAIIGQLLLSDVDKDRYEIVIAADYGTYRSVSTGRLVDLRRVL